VKSCCLLPEQDRASPPVSGTHRLGTTDKLSLADGPNWALNSLQTTNFWNWHNLMLDWITGPVATIIASIVAALFAGAQVCVARTQKDIAYEKLKVALFEKLYAIYLATKELIEYTLEGKGNSAEDVNFIRKHYIALEEARFFFEPEIQAFLRNVKAKCETLFETLAEKDMMNPEDNPEAWRDIANRVAEQRRKLSTMYSELPDRFENALGFKLLKSPRR
jgi:hypothetical protein